MPLTPEQFNKLATKDDIKELNAKVDQITDNMSQLLTAVDGLT